MVLHFISRFKKCPKCDSTEHLEVRNYDMRDQTGEVWCSKCEEYVREYDAS